MNCEWEDFYAFQSGYWCYTDGEKFNWDWCDGICYANRKLSTGNDLFFSTFCL